MIHTGFVRSAKRWNLAVPTALSALLLAAAACSEEEKLPEAESWEARSPLPEGHPGEAGQNPHAGGSGAPYGGDPHAGVEGAPPLGDHPHEGGATNPDMAQFDPPDPNRPIDPNRYLRGMITDTEETSANIDRGDIIFLSAKPVDPATGQALGAPIAVDRLIVSEFPMEFELTEEHMMVAGTSFEGDVVVEARVDSDGEAMTRIPGDVEGTVRAEIPADGLGLELDTIIE